MGRADEHVPKDLFATQRLVRQMFGGDDEAFPEVSRRPSDSNPLVVMSLSQSVVTSFP
jgi:hypothetical protein